MDNYSLCGIPHMIIVHILEIGLLVTMRWYETFGPSIGTGVTSYNTVVENLGSVIYVISVIHLKSSLLHVEVNCSTIVYSNFVSVSYKISCGRIHRFQS